MLIVSPLGQIKAPTVVEGARQRAAYGQGSGPGFSPEHGPAAPCQGLPGIHHGLQGERVSLWPFAPAAFCAQDDGHAITTTCQAWPLGVSPSVI